MRISDEFLILLRSALTGEVISGFGLETLSRTSESTWSSIAATAREQSLEGLIGAVVTTLPQEVPIPDQILYHFAAEKEKAVIKSSKMVEATDTAVSLFNKTGLHPIVMKGPATAAFYPSPELRSYGDIDLYFNQKEFEKARSIAASREDYKVSGDGSFHFSLEGVDVDAHDSYFDLHRPVKDLPEVPSPEATLVMLSAHAMKHACGTGLGLRQICDMAMAYKALEGKYDKNCLENFYSRLGMTRWNSLLSSFIIRRLGIDVPCPEGPVPDNALLRIVEEGGNFGHHAQGRAKTLGKSSVRRKIDTAARFIKRLPFSMRYAPGETLRTIFSLTKGNL